MRRLLATLMVATLIGAASAMPAAGQDGSPREGPPTELWDKFPLEQPPPESARGTAPQSGSAPEASAQGEPDDGSSAALPLALGAIAGLALLAGAAVVRRRRRRLAAAVESATPPAVEPAPLPAATAAEPNDAAAAAAGGPERGDAAPATEPRSADGEAAEVEAPALPQPARERKVASGRALGYASVSAANGQAGDELKLQIRLIEEACTTRRLTLVKVVRDVESHAGSGLRRPGLTYALDRLAAGEADCLVVTSLERLSRTASHLGTMLGWLEECDARLVVLDLDLDTGTQEGQVGAKALATLGGLERKKVEERTRKGLEAARQMRRSGRPAVSDQPSLKQRIAAMRAEGMTLQAIADTLNAEGVPTLRGGAEWRPSSVQAAAGYKRPSRRDRPRPARPRDDRPKAR
jgi:DNA invertase Pin-like site-specific DNA recombinase